MAKVKGGTISPVQVVVELERLSPLNWTWEVKEHEDNSMLVSFPNAMELHRMVEFGELNVKNRPGVKLEFDYWQDQDEAKMQLPVVWVKVGGNPKEL
uniref:DUF4283 domain-containing protein n=1 Tax=Arundo donax TaxID=35708 RepID=A0A0A9DMP9_ARUDO